MPTLQRFTPASEVALHLLIKAELDAIEEGLVLLQQEYSSGKGILDFLCIDSGGRLVIIEVKLHEDENILFQALRYFSDIDRNRHLIATLFSDKPIATDQSPRILLIAERFSEDVRRLSTLVVPEVELLEYNAVKLPDGKRGLCFHTASLPSPPSVPATPSSIEKLIEYLKEDSLKPVVAELRELVKNISPSIEEYPTQGYIGYKHTSGRQFAYIRMYRKAIELGAHIIDERKRLLDYDGIRIETGDEDYSAVMEQIRTSFKNLGG